MLAACIAANKTQRATQMWRRWGDMLGLHHCQYINSHWESESEPAVWVAVVTVSVAGVCVLKLLELVAAVAVGA